MDGFALLESTDFVFASDFGPSFVSFAFDLGVSVVVFDWVVEGLEVSAKALGADCLDAVVVVLEEFVVVVDVADEEFEEVAVAEAAGDLVLSTFCILGGVPPC